ncbi:MAG: hypothetical protein ACJAVI_002692 [Candidatus Azotimanducaceae bacterium]|jgi:hypothetical protein
MREAGLLDSGKIVSFTQRVVGEETGFLGEIAILSLTYSPEVNSNSTTQTTTTELPTTQPPTTQPPTTQPPTTQPPTTVVLKIPTALKNRVLGQSLGVYEKEIRFYSTLKDKLNIRTPRFYYGALSAADDPGVVLERLKSLNRMPIALIAVIGVIAQWIFGLMPRSYVLLIEDVSHYRLGDQAAGCSDNDIKIALNSMASLHAQFWNSEELNSLSWVTPVEFSSKLVHMGYLQSANKYLKENREKLSENQLRLHDWLKKNGTQLTERLGKGPRTFLHGDFRVDNLCFDDNAGEMLLLDWQTAMSGSYGLELAYFLSTALPANTPDEKLDEMIEHYRKSLAQLGINIPKNELRREFDIGMVAIVHRISPILHQTQLELGTGRGPEIMRNWIDSAYRKLENVELASILEGY